MFSPRRYQVVGSQPVAPGWVTHYPGEFFEEDIPFDREMFLIRVGALRVVPVEHPKTLPPLDIEPPEPQTAQEEEALNG